jgi:archaellum biogenesis protein FlaJ (TadC family)
MLNPCFVLSSPGKQFITDVALITPLSNVEFVAASIVMTLLSLSTLSSILVTFYNNFSRPSQGKYSPLSD